MGLFDRQKEPVFLKTDSEAEKQLAALRKLRGKESASGLSQEIRMVEAGIAGEERIRFELENSHMPMYVLHDLFLEREGRVLVSPPLQFAQWPDDPMQQLSEMSDWWDFVSPISSSDAHHYRDVITTQLRRGRYNHLSGPFLRLLRGIPDPGPFCAAFVPVMIEAIWALHAELSLRTLLESLSLTVLTRKPPEAVTAWLTSLSDVLDACPRDHAPDLELVLQTIRQNPSLPYTQARLAHSLGISPAYFCRLFHEKTGQPFSSFLIEARIQLARTLLADRTLSIQEVAEKCGYTNRIYFSRLFRAYTGISPADYAQQLLSVSDASDLRS